MPQDPSKGQPKPPSPPVTLVTAGNIDLSKRKPVSVGNGMYATVRSISIPVNDQDPKGKQVVIPTVSPDGKLLSDHEAIMEYVRSGKHLGIAKNIPDAEKFARWLHLQEAKRIGK